MNKFLYHNYAPSKFLRRFLFLTQTVTEMKVFPNACWTLERERITAKWEILKHVILSFLKQKQSAPIDAISSRINMIFPYFNVSHKPY